MITVCAVITYAIDIFIYFGDTVIDDDNTVSWCHTYHIKDSFLL